MDEVYTKIGDDLEVIKNLTEESKIQKFYAGKTVFLTGSTGFMGKALLEKLLRSCPDLKCIYVMIRPKKGLSVEERMKKFFTDVLFDTLRGMNPNFESKVHPMEGDLAKEDLGLSEQDKKIIIEETNIMFHNASDVKFLERFSSIARVNVLGTLITTDLAMKCKNIEAFMYVSTAYSHSYRLDIKEEAYAPPADLDMIKNLIAGDEAVSTGISKTDTKSLLGPYPNVYVYTKAAAEGLVYKMAKQAPFPCVIYRPSIVMSAWKEPLRGWIDNLNGPGMMFTAYGLGVVHTTVGNNTILDFVPVDMVTNFLIVSMWDAVENRTKNSEVLIYNYGSSTVKPINMKRFRALCDPCGLGKHPVPSAHMIWKNFFVPTNCVWYFFILHILFHFIPAIFVDAYLLATGKKPMALSTFKKITLTFSVLKFFLTNTWMIDIKETTKAVDRMNSVDRELFFCDLRELDWPDYALTYWHGLRFFIVKDPMSTMEKGVRRYRILNYLHKTIVFALSSYAVYFIVTRLGLM